MRPNRSLSHIWFTVMVFSLVFFCMFSIRANAETDFPPIPVDPDYDNDFDSDGLDFYNFVKEYELNDCGETTPCWFDSDLDGNLDGVDVAYFAADFGRADLDFYEHDDTFDQAGVVVVDYEKHQHHNFHQYGDEDWMKFFALSEEKYEIQTELSPICVSTFGNNCNIVLELYNDDKTLLIYEDTFLDPNWNETIEWTCPKDKDGIYYVKVYQYESSTFGAAAIYDMRITQSNAPFPGTIYGTVKNAITKIPIKYALIRTTAGGHAMSFPNGMYIMTNHPAGDYNLTATATGYSPFTALISVTEFGVLRINIEMAP